MAWRDAIQGVSMKPSAGYLRDPWMTFWFGWLSAGIFSRFLNARGNLVLFLIAMLVLVLRGDLGKPESLSNQTPSVPTKPSFTQAELPSNVVWFERLMYLALGISLILTFLQWDYVVDVFVNDFGFPDPASAFVTMLLGYAPVVLLIWQAARRRKNWARWVLCILIAIQLSALYRWTGLNKYLTQLGQGLLIGQDVVLAFALFLIFTGNARAWFKGSANLES